MKRFFLVLLAIILLTANAQAIKENEVFDLVDPENTTLPLKDILSGEDYFPLELEVYYSENFDYNSTDECMQLPKFNDEEKLMAQAMQEEWNKGKRPKNSILNKANNVVVGVYELSAKDFNGETTYTLLPNRKLTKEEVLEIIDAFESLKLKFDPENLSYKNCARGGGTSSNRFMREYENEKIKTLSELYKRKSIKPKASFTPLPNDDGNGEIKLDSESYNGLDSFSFKPYREMSDDELLQIVSNSVGSIYASNKLNDYEAIAREELQRVFNAPASIKLIDESKQIAGKSNVFLKDIEVYCADFEAQENNDSKMYYHAMIDVSDGSLYYGLFSQIDNLEYSDLHGDPYNDYWKEATRNIIKKYRNDDVNIMNVEGKAEIYDSQTGYCLHMQVYMQDKSYYEIGLRYQDESVRSLCYYRDEPNPYDAYKEEMMEANKK